MNSLRIFLLAALWLGTVPVVSCQQPANDDVVKHVDAATFQKLAKTPGTVLLDVRTAQEFSEGHLQGAQNLDFSSEGFSASIAGLDKSMNYMVYCKSGRRSAMAAEQMKDAGFTKITDLKGGITAWREARLPVAR